MKRVRIHNILVCVGDGYDAAFDDFLANHSVSLEPSGNVYKAKDEGKRFANFLAEFCDPAFLMGLTENLPEPPSQSK